MTIGIKPSIYFEHLEGYLKVSHTVDDFAVTFALPNGRQTTSLGEVFKQGARPYIFTSGACIQSCRYRERDSIHEATKPFFFQSAATKESCSSSSIDAICSAPLARLTLRRTMAVNSSSTILRAVCSRGNGKIDKLTGSVYNELILTQIKLY
jgi:hypothetical protein